MSWLSSNLVKVGQKERAIITVAGIAPDVDGIGLLLDPIIRAFGGTSNYWGQWHHTLHSFTFCMLIAAASYVLAKANKFTVACVAFIVFHLHLLFDLVGSRGPDGYQWPIPYLEPFSDLYTLTWQHQWALNAWQNVVIGFVLLISVGLVAKRYHRSPFEVISKRMDEAFVRMVQRTF
ncbi:metal-dependent hydrolase [Reinekea sp. G2M2-21]|uniref:metal-dependent hydrolase n=1 Tax=Reinekea sp. G2M2-21 TaxID=2788942 RepID=UPI0018AB706F|nr:metal-dependent hydrolase [Reinekea sp. G2M2-21]